MLAVLMALGLEGMNLRIIILDCYGVRRSFANRIQTNTSAFT
jgi:hypothetical protein